MKWQADRRRRKEVEVWKKGDKVMLSMKDLVFKERLAKKLVNQYIGPYFIDEVISTNAVKLWLPNSIRMIQRASGRQKVKEVKLVEVERVEECEVEKTLKKKKIWEVVKYLVWWKGFTAEHNI